MARTTKAATAVLEVAVTKRQHLRIQVVGAQSLASGLERLGEGTAIGTTGMLDEALVAARRVRNLLEELESRLEAWD